MIVTSSASAVGKPTMAGKRKREDEDGVDSVKVGGGSSSSGGGSSDDDAPLATAKPKGDDDDDDDDDDDAPLDDDIPLEKARPKKKAKIERKVKVERTGKGKGKDNDKVAGKAKADADPAMFGASLCISALVSSVSATFTGVPRDGGGGGNPLLSTLASSIGKDEDQDQHKDKNALSSSSSSSSSSAPSSGILAAKLLDAYEKVRKARACTVCGLELKSQYAMRKHRRALHAAEMEALQREKQMKKEHSKERSARDKEALKAGTLCLLCCSLVIVRACTQQR